MTEVPAVSVEPIDRFGRWALAESEHAHELAPADVVAAVRAANASLIAAAGEQLSTLLPELPATAWTDDAHWHPAVWQARPTTLGVGGMELLDDLVATESPDGGRVTFSGGGRPEHQPPPPTAVHPRQHPAMSPTKLSGPGLIAALTDGLSAIFSHSDDVHPLLGEWATGFGRWFGAQVSFNTYVSIGGRGGAGFGGHWDEQDVIAIPLLGQKTWEVAPPIGENALLGAVPQGFSTGPAESTELFPGRALVIPRGWTHRVTHRAEGLSLHVTVGIVRPRAQMIVRTLVDRSIASAPLRADLPTVASRQTGAATPVAELAEELRHRATPAEIESCRALVVATMGARPFDSASTALDLLGGAVDDLWIDSAVASRLVLGACTDESALIATNNRVLRVRREVLQPTLNVLSARSRPLTALGSDEIALARDLIFAGVARAKRTPSFPNW